MFPYAVDNGDGNQNNASWLPKDSFEDTTQTKLIKMFADRKSDPTSVSNLPTNNNLTTKKKRETMFDFKSEAVKKVEQIAKERDERRKKQEQEKTMRMQNNMHLNGPYREFSQMIQDYKNCIEINVINDNDAVDDNQITVCVRKRPLNNKELDRNEVDVVTVTTKDQLIVHEPKQKVDLTKYLDNQNFRFDYVFHENCNNELIYKFTAKPLIKTIFEGGMATCFAYGQTGSGKTHTMGGEFKGRKQNFESGIYGLAAKDIFGHLNLPEHSSKNLIVTASFFEIYGKLAFDLLSKKHRLRVLEDGRQTVQVVGLSEHSVSNISNVLELIKKGSLERTSGHTSANINSSRSHAVFQIILRKAGVRKIYGKFSLIDLAGNERGADNSNSDKQTQIEGADINRSLLALKECIRALGKKGKHCPFRESILTKILRDSFIGERTKTCMIAMISPNVSSVEHSLNTLRYADRVKELGINDMDDNEISKDDP